MSYHDSNLILDFLPGNHTLVSELSFSHLVMVSFLANYDLSSNFPPTLIFCNDDARFEFLDVQTVQIVRLIFIGCTGNELRYVKQFTIEHSSFDGLYGKDGTALILYFVFGNMLNSSFTNNNGHRLHYIKCRDLYGNEIDVSTTAGGALYMEESQITIEWSRFRGNSGGVGGAVFSGFNSNITINNSYFAKNHATGSKSQITTYCNGGGALFADDAKYVTLVDSQFTNNSASACTNGGAIEVYHANTVTISGSELKYNEAGCDGGAIYVYDTKTVNITSSELKNNRAVNGGAIYVHCIPNYVSTLMITGKFEHNIAELYGGCVYVIFVSTFTMSASILKDNTAGNGGGAIYALHVLTVAINDSHLKNNTAEKGGAINMGNIGMETILIINHTDFTSNIAHKSGGALSSETVLRHCIVTNSKFITNVAHEHGGVLELQNSTDIEITKSNFSNNQVIGNGGIIIMNDGNFAISYSRFELNTAGESGGILLSHSSDINISSSYFISNRAKFGGVLHIHNAMVTGQDLVFFNNSANRLGGTFYIVQSTTNICEGTFENNQADSKGGYLYMVGGSLSIKNSMFSNSRAHFGGALYAHKANFTGNNVHFFNNSANSQGGALYLENNYADDNSGPLYIDHCLFVKNSMFSNNRANFGGALYALNANLTVNKVHFFNNSANNGGAFYSIQTITTMCEGFFENTHVESKGGSLYIDGCSLFIKNSVFCNNRANLGGVVYAHNANFTVKQAHFSNNAAKTHGGAFYNLQSIANIANVSFETNYAYSYGGAHYIDKGSILVKNSTFSNNRANFGGCLHTQNSTITLHNILYFNNSATIHGGVYRSFQSITTFCEGNFVNNNANNNGGTLYIERGSTLVKNSTFFNNSASNDGGVMRSHLNNLTIFGCMFNNNKAVREGGVLWTDQCFFLNVSETTFLDNTADCGGVLYIEQGYSLIHNTVFTNNKARAGGVLWAKYANITSISCNITHNRGNFSVLYLITSTSVWSTLTFSENLGSILMVESNVVISGDSKMENNVQSPLTTVINGLQRGGAITATIQSRITIKGTCVFRKNSAQRGGALNIIESKLNIHGNVTVVSNKARVSGGGINLDHSELICNRNSTLNLFGNDGSKKGGGVMATSSTILIKGLHNVVNISHNKANNGGGLYFKLNTNFLIFKSKASNAQDKIVIFTSNSASEYGGAVYVSDDGMCSLLTVTDCSFQTLATYSPNDYDSSNAEYHNIFFYNNTAGVSGNSLFGGLLDRCTINTFAEPNINKVDMDYTALNGSMITNGAEYLQSISNIVASDVSSNPVRVCFCREGEETPDCSFQPGPIEIDKGYRKNVSISLSVVDQLNQTLQQTRVYSNFRSGNSLCQNHILKMDGKCTKLDFVVDLVNDTEELILSFRDGPCENTPRSKGNITLLFVCSHCPIGFELENTESGCKCSCDSKLFPYFTNCSGETLVRENKAWVTFLNNSGNYTDYQYLVHPYCPLDYCHPPSSNIKINLNQPNGADSQCTDYRSGLLCSTCQTGFSLSLGSSSCIPCSTNWPVSLTIIITSAILGGLLLVIFFLSFNLTVAVGTLNGIIFYANIVFANRSILLPSSTPIFITIIISWLNLEIGFDTCFYDGLDTYWKTLLQLAFPVYVIFLVILVIVISEYSNKFAQLIGKRNPVATLATLILLSYAKLLHNIIASLSFTVLSYPDHNNEIVWFPDASVGYLKGKHIALFVIAVLILLAGIFYTTILMLWQWFLCLSHKKMFAWIKNQKLCHFIEPYHAPYAFKHRYWTGLLLLARVILYVIFATNFEGDPQLSLLVITFAVGVLFLFKGVLAAKIYKNRPVEVLETIMYFNLIAFAALTSYYIDDDSSKAAIATTSVSITFILLMIVIAFHVYKYSCIRTTIRKKKLLKKIKAKIPGNRKKQADERSVDNVPPPPAVELREITYSVVEIHTPKI